jgi:hypothetical protein
MVRFDVQHPAPREAQLIVGDLKLSELMPCSPPSGGRLTDPTRISCGGGAEVVGLFFSSTPLTAMTGSDPIDPVVAAFVRGLRNLGYIEGQNLLRTTSCSPKIIHIYSPALRESSPDHSLVSRPPCS